MINTMTKPAPKLAFNQDHIKRFQFKQLFNELGWNLPIQQQPFSVGVGTATWLLDVVAEKKGVQILHCRPDAQGHLPDYATRQKIERKVTAEALHHLIVFTDAAQSRQVWQWVTRQHGKPVQYREVAYEATKDQDPALLTQKLSRLHFTLDEEDLLTVLGVAQRLDDATPRKTVTKDFYTEFEKVRKVFAEFINGIPATGDDQRWYTAVLINRLMFLWFLQEGDFLDAQKNYLKLRLAKHLSVAQSTSFYKKFLVPLFFRGFAEERSELNSAAIASEFGNVPYLNGGLFAPHELEQRYGEALDVADAAFSKLFDFFIKWDWHLDERPLKSGKEINPDVLGYIFEKFVNQKQMGAYYTKEDITDYIGKNTIIPCLLAKVRAEHPKAFDDLVWPLLQQSGDAYIYPAMLKGMPPLLLPLPLGEGRGEGSANGLPTYPPEIAAGQDTEAPDLLARRKPWNKRADEQLSLPTEIWRETIARHQRTREVRAKIAAGDLKDVGDLITYNLDIRQFAQDLIERCTDVALLKSFWFALAGRLPYGNAKLRHGLSVLDPTCGSGAFLFAALNILKPLYDATLRTLQAVRSDALIAGEKSRLEKWAEVDGLLERFATNDSDRAQDYAVIKHIIVNNLYGVDIEEQATEIAKLRLFLKLVSLLEPGDKIDPLPDIDFNIRHGNTLVGYATEEETKRAVLGVGSDGQPLTGNLFGDDPWSKIKVDLVVAEEKYNNFQLQQVQLGGHVSPEDKKNLRQAIAVLEETLNEHLAKEYGVDPTKANKYADWKNSHQPFHWFVDFYPLMASGGFDVVIGNPPFVEYSKIRSTYVPIQIKCLSSGNLWAFVIERSLSLLGNANHLGMVVPHAIAATYRVREIQNTLLHNFSAHLSYYSRRPGKLFDGVDQCICIVIGQKMQEASHDWHSTGYMRWQSEARDQVFELVSYTKYDAHKWMEQYSVFPKLGSQMELDLLKKLTAFPKMGESMNSDGFPFYVHRISRYYIKATNFVPYFRSDRDGEKRSDDFKLYRARSGLAASVATLSLNTSLFYWFWRVLYDGYHCGKENISEFSSFAEVNGLDADSVNSLLARLMDSFQANAVRKSTVYKGSGVVEYDEFKLSKSKDVLDAVDTYLLSKLSISPLQLDFISNYDIKYRMGQGMEDSDD